MNQIEYETLRKDYLKKIRELNIKLGAEHHTQLYCWFSENYECCLRICLCRAVTDNEYNGLWIVNSIETYLFTKGATPKRWATTFELLKTHIRELLPNEEKYFLYKELSEQAQHTYDVAEVEWMYEEYYQDRYDYNEYIDRKIIGPRLDNDKRIYKEDGEIGDFRDPNE